MKYFSLIKTSSVCALEVKEERQHEREGRERERERERKIVYVFFPFFVSPVAVQASLSCGCTSLFVFWFVKFLPRDRKGNGGLEPWFIG
jgi:hypothetical protein